MERGIIEVDPRHTIRSMRSSMQGSIIRALIELIINADDSYKRLEEGQNKICGEIEIKFIKEGTNASFYVKDYAEGMSFKDIKNCFTTYGTLTSGIKSVKNVRGYFGQGAKDALINMIDGEIISIKDNILNKCKLFIDDEKPKYEISDPTNVTESIREKYGIHENGTIAFFKADPEKTGPIPQFDTLHKEIANNFMLRKISTNLNRKLFLIDGKNNKKRRFRGPLPTGDKILDEEFEIQYRSFPKFKIKIIINKSENELKQAGDDRDGGLLIIDENDNVLAISLFKYDNEPLASHFFGEVKIFGFRELLLNEEPVLSDERDGLLKKHPFCKELISEIEKRIDIKVKEEKLLKQKEDQAELDEFELKRFKKAFNILNDIAESELEEVINLGDNVTTQEIIPQDDFCIYPDSAQITVNKKYAFKIFINKNLVKKTTTIKVSSNSPKIDIMNKEIIIQPSEKDKILKKSITIMANEPNINGKIKASMYDKISEANVFVNPEKELILSEGMAFQPESLTLYPNQCKKVYLLVYVKIIESGSKIRITSDNEAIQISKNEIIVNEFDAERHIAKYEIELWGEGVGQRGTITAEFEERIALLDVKIRSKEKIEDKYRKGLFNKPEFNDDPDPYQRVSYSEETGKVIIYINFPSIKHYLGDEGKYRKTLPAQIIIADLVAERCFYEIARRKISKNALIDPEAKSERIQRDANELSKKYGEKIHKALVDQYVLNEYKFIEKP